MLLRPPPIAAALRFKEAMTRQRQTSLPILKSLPSVVAEIFKQNPPIWGALRAQGHARFFSGFDFMMGLGKPKLHTKSEVASFSHFRNIKGEPKVLVS